VIVDTSALIAVLRREAGFEAFEDAIERAFETRLSAGNYLELAIVLDSRRNPVVSRDLDEFLHDAAIRIEPVTETQARIAREAYRDYGRGSGHPAQLNFGDCFAYALARDLREPLLYKGADFSHTDIASALQP
jgi:ribonuclease VapC